LRNEQSATASALSRALEELRKAQEPSRRLLTWLAEARMRPGKALQGGGNSADVVYDRLLRFLGFVLYKIVNRLNPDGPPPEFYFWPGYNSVSENATRRIQINPAQFPEIGGGIGFEPEALTLRQWDYANRLMQDDYRCGDGDYDLSDTSLWFDCVLSPEHEDYRNSRLILGGTHQWVTNGQITLSDESPLDVLSVCVGEPLRGDGAGEQEDDTRPQRGRIHIPLASRTFLNWGQRIAAVLNDEKTLKFKYKWPTPNNLSLVETFASDEHALIITCRLYGIWLKANFDPSWRLNNVHTMIDDVRRLGEWQYIGKLADRVETLALARVKGPAFVRELTRETSYPQELVETFSRLRKHEYRYWYTLVLKKTADLPDLKKVPGEPGPAGRGADVPCPADDDSKDVPTELGSAMLLSSVRLPDEFLHVIKLWVESIYLEIRAVETSILLRDKANLDGQLKQARQFAHQTSGLITTPWLDEQRKDMSDWSQFCLWMAKTLITQVWGTATIRYDEELQEDYMEWAGLELKDVLERLVNLSLEYAIQRATKASRTTYDEDIDKFNWEFYEEANALSFEADRVPQLRERLGVSLPPGEPMGWMKYKPFALFFYHALWQAAHHAMRASAADKGLAPYLWMEWDASSLIIYNRAPSSIPVTVSPKDREFFKRLSERYQEPFEDSGPFEVVGPEPIAQEGANVPPVWRTIIRFQERRP
jgi:hypothetical protein